MQQQEVVPCACGPRYAGGCGGRCAASAPAFSLLFPMPMRFPPEQCYYYHAEDGGCGGQVDCTLSLATPSTRLAEAAGVVHARAGGGGGSAAVLVEEPRQEGSPPRRCANCDTTSTPLWRNGPRGPKSLCNACGIRYKKEERRAAAAVAPAPATQDSGVWPYACGGYARPPPPQQQQWGCYGPAAGKSAASYGMYGGDGVVDADGPCLSWMLNVVPSSPAFAVRERHTLFQYY
ncbi:unnamed protein product [Miscanthus lutarioriparius]|uniref:GATA-type domain-containing protein n=1 Tax=Miscanthus lutarioriparius TaxID=422564 RepID=A0A811RL30_9POAL|nr:unnamed protein product [Miscanthus lutarioriparius]